MTTRLTARWMALAVLTIFTASPVWAAAISTTLGAQDYNDGDILGGVLGFNAASAGEAAPFDGYKGSDISENFSENFTFNYTPLGDPILSASITIGIFDHDSAASGSQVLAFSVGGVDLTTGLDALFEGSGGAQGEVNIYTLVLGASTFSSLATGSPTFSLQLNAPGLTFFESSFNGAGLDFATLDLTTLDQDTVVPEPSTWLLFSSGVLGLIWRMRSGRGR